MTPEQVAAKIKHQAQSRAWKKANPEKAKALVAAWRAAKLSPEKTAFYQAKGRCVNPNDPVHYPNYGGRGITFEFKSFEQFITELGPRPEGTSLDRIDNNQGYKPGNVKWATPKEQANNRRSTV